MTATGGPAVASPLLEANGVGAGYGGVDVISDITISVQPGEVVALLGPNGAGKSTTLFALSGHIRPSSGVVRLYGKVTREPLYRRCRHGLSFVPEGKAIFPSLTAAENLRLGRGGVELAGDLMPELRPLLRRKAGLLSGGEQQILCLARAIASNPQLLMIDELSIGLAPMVIERLLAQVRAAADRGVGVLIVEQYARRALAIADRAYVMRRGKITMQGSADDMQDRIEEVEGMYLSHAEPDTGG